MVMIDACVFIDYFRSKNKENTFLAKLTRGSRKCCTSAVAKYEVLVGADEKDLDEWRRIFDKITVFAFGDATINSARMIYRQLKQESKLISLGDILIAATAIANDLPLATFNRSHFERIRDLRLIG